MADKKEKDKKSDSESDWGEDEEEKEEKKPKNDDDSDKSGWESQVSDKDVRHAIKDLAKEESDIDEEAERKNDPRCRKAKNLIREYAQMATMHGMNHLGEAHSCKVICFWGLMLLICLACFAFLFSDTFNRYIKFDSSVGITMGVKQRTFPAISICNLSPYSLSGLQSLDTLNALVLAYDYAINQKINDINYWNEKGKLPDPS